MEKERRESSKKGNSFSNVGGFSGVVGGGGVGFSSTWCGRGVLGGRVGAGFLVRGRGVPMVGRVCEFQQGMTKVEKKKKSCWTIRREPSGSSSLSVGPLA